MSPQGRTAPTTVARGGPLGRLWSLHRWPVSALVLRAVMVLAPVGAVLLAAAAGDAPPLSVAAVVAVFSVGFAVAPESGFGLLALGSAAAWWCRVGDDGLHPSVLVAAVLLTLAHVAGLVASYGPAGARVDPAVATVWVTRAALVLLACPAVWVVARVVRDGAPQASLWQAGLAVSALAVAGAAVMLGPDWPGRR